MKAIAYVDKMIYITGTDNNLEEIYYYNMKDITYFTDWGEPVEIKAPI